LYSSSYERTLPFVVGARVAAIVTGDPPGLATLVLPRIEAPNVGELPEPPAHVVLHGSFNLTFSDGAALSARDSAARELLTSAPTPPTFGEALLRALADLGLERARIGWDDPLLMQEVHAGAGAGNNVDGRQAWRALRRVKSNEEIRRLEQSASVT